MSYETILTLIGIVLGSNWLGQFLMEIYKGKTKKRTPSEIILKSLARSHLLLCAKRFKEQGYIPADEYEDIFEEFDAYEKLSGNGLVRREYSEGGDVRSLPVK